MFKSTSEHMQNQATGAVLRSRANSGGLDGTTFHTERAKLVNRKKVLEADIAEVTARILRAKSLAHQTGNFTRAKTFERWTFEKIAKVREINQIDAQLLDMRQQSKEHYASTTWTPSQYDMFNKTFHQMAKDMLAGDVYERLRQAAIHRIGEEG